MSLGLTPLVLVCTKTLLNHDGTEAFTKNKTYQTDGYINYYNKIPDGYIVLIDNQNDEHRVDTEWKQFFKLENPNIDLNKYEFTINSDQGKHKVSTNSINLVSALQLLLNAEKCPEGAVINIKITKLKNDKSKV